MCFVEPRVGFQWRGKKLVTGGGQPQEDPRLWALRFPRDWRSQGSEIGQGQLGSDVYMYTPEILVLMETLPILSLWVLLRWGGIFAFLVEPTQPLLTPNFLCWESDLNEYFSCSHSSI